MQVDKEKIMRYLDTNLSFVASDKTDYRMSLISSGGGSYAGIAYARFGSTYRLVEFIIDFPNRYFSIKGSSGKELVKNTGNLNSLFNWGKIKIVSGNDDPLTKNFFDLIQGLGILFEFRGERSNIGRSLFRTIVYHPFAEVLVNTLNDYCFKHDFKSFFNYMQHIDDFADHFPYYWEPDMLKVVRAFLLYLEYVSNTKKTTSIRKALGLSKRETSYFLKMLLNNAFECPIMSRIINRLRIERLIDVAYALRGKSYYINEYSKTSGTINDLNDKQRFDHEMEKIRFVVKQLHRVYQMMTTYNLDNFIKQVLVDVGNTRGYHDAMDYYRDNMSGLLDDLIAYALTYVPLSRYDPMPAYQYQNNFMVMYTLGIIHRGKIDLVSLRHFIQYAYGSAYHQQALGYRDFLNTYSDYLNMVSSFPNYNKYPRYLKTAHDIATRNQEATTGFDKQVFDQYNKYKYLEKTFGEWAMVLLASPAEIVREGQVQGNCVGSYANYVHSHVDLILSMRKKDAQDKSIVTVELLIPEGEGKDKQNKLIMIQAYASYDKVLNEEQTRALVSYCNKMHINVEDRHSTLVKGISPVPINYVGDVDTSIHEQTLKDAQEASTKRIDDENMPKAV